jgi:hypothetical protein
MRITSVLEETYIPKAMKNRKLPQADQVVATLRHPTVAEYEPIAKDPIAVVSTHVVKLANLVVNEKPVTTGTELVALPRKDVGALASELYLLLVNGAALSPEVEKNSESLPS